MSIEQTGRNSIALGRALLDESTEVGELADLATKCGLQVQMRLIPYGSKDEKFHDEPPTTEDAP